METFHRVGPKNGLTVCDSDIGYLWWAVRENILSDIGNIFFTELKQDLSFWKVNGSEWTLNGEQEKTAKWNKVQESRTKLTKSEKWFWRKKGVGAIWRNRGSVKSMECQGDAEKLGNRRKNEVAVYCESKVH